MALKTTGELRPEIYKCDKDQSTPTRYSEFCTRRWSSGDCWFFPNFNYFILVDVCEEWFIRYALVDTIQFAIIRLCLLLALASFTNVRICLEHVQHNLMIVRLVRIAQNYSVNGNIYFN